MTFGGLQKYYSQSLRRWFEDAERRQDVEIKRRALFFWLRYPVLVVGYQCFSV